MPDGRVIRGVGGIWTVLSAGGESLTCAARGRIKRSQGEIVVGDLVAYSAGPDGAVIEALRPRRHLLRRPLVANSDQAMLVFALRDPDPSRLLIDRFLTAIQAAGLPVVLCFNKTDLVRPKEAETLAGYYRDLGYRAILTSAVTGRGQRMLLSCLHGLTTVFCGPSGVGKSALLNVVQPGAALATGEVSAKIGRGRHTTRMARLLPVGRDGFVVDTPGYTQVDLVGIDRRRLADLFPEIKARGGQCRFSGCLHLAEPGCQVKEAVTEGLLPRARYEHYCLFLAELSGKSGNNRYRCDR